ncbi:MAG: helix-turn-helix domain-containing protein [Gammaproteobacteria bacterium]|nr:helix-turn-helix domain-containing protein [Gammaproteobacteria bacterium]
MNNLSVAKINTAKQKQCETCDLGYLCFPEAGASPDYLKNTVQRDRTYKRGETVFRAGETMRSLYGICAGSVKTSTINSDGTSQITGFHFVGDILGMDALNGKQYLYDAVALEPVRIREISYDRLKKLAGENPDIQESLTRLMSNQLAFDYQLLMPMVGKKSAAQQLASYIHALAQRFQQRNMPDTEFRLTMSRNDIANYLGLAKETISRLFSRFEEEGLVTSHAKYISIADPDKLASLAVLGDPSP